ncbi:hypothetical protein [Haloterrigena salinisoli]|uniref:hypothetical protein n=1 Tax=Haloterrigena salinisoli TaxID=3132747 RepID=UPI0030CB9AB1
MVFEVKTDDKRPEYLENIDVDSESGLVILPVYSPLSEESNKLVDAPEAATVEKLWEQNEVHHERIEGKGTLAQFSDATSLPPLYATFEFIKDNPEIVMMAFETLQLYYQRRTSDDVELEVTVESENKSTSMKYTGSVEGLKNIPEKMSNKLEMDFEMKEEDND